MDSTAGNPMAGGSMLPPDMPDDFQPAQSAAAEEDKPSLKSDVEALIADGKTYLEAELAFQKSRAGYTADGAKWTAIYGAAALGLIHLALIALTVGVLIALAPLIGPWLATAVVVALLLLGALVFVLKLRGKIAEIGAVFRDGEP